MRVGYFADGPWSHNALQKILTIKNVELAFIVPRFDTQDPVLKAKAEELNIPFFPHENVNSKPFLDWVKRQDVDLMVSMSFNQILKKEIIDLTPMGFINCHAGLLPFYRGRNPLNWALINGESHFGVTVHYVDEGIDTGDIIVQQKEKITPDDNYSTLLERAFPLCGEVLCSAVELIEKGAVSPIRQEEIHPVGFYCGMRRPGDEFIDWNWSSERLHDFIRGITAPAPGARCYVDGKQFAVLSSKIIKDAPDYICTSGEVVGRCDSGCIVKTGTSTILIENVALINEEDDATEIHKAKWKIGTRLSKLS